MYQEKCVKLIYLATDNDLLIKSQPDASCSMAAYLMTCILFGNYLFRGSDCKTLDLWNKRESLSIKSSWIPHCEHACSTNISALFDLFQLDVRKTDSAELLMKYQCQWNQIIYKLIFKSDCSAKWKSYSSSYLHLCSRGRHE